MDRATYGSGVAGQKHSRVLWHLCFGSVSFHAVGSKLAMRGDEFFISLGVAAKPRAHFGGTMVELLLAIFVLVVAGAGIVGTYISAHALSLNASDTSTALEDLKDIMERIEATPYTLLGNDFPDGVADGGLSNDYENIVGGYQLDNQQVVVTYPTQSSIQTEIVATVSWMQRGRTRAISLSTFRSSS